MWDFKWTLRWFICEIIRQDQWFRVKEYSEEMWVSSRMSKMPTYDNQLFNCLFQLTTQHLKANLLSWFLFQDLADSHLQFCTGIQNSLFVSSLVSMLVIRDLHKMHMSHFAYACKTEGENGISRLISALCLNCLSSISEYSRLNHLHVYLV